MHVMFCVSGFSGVGKDEFTSVLNNEFGAIQTGLVDPAKRHMADVYGFTEQQLFGPSAYRNKGDIRYPKPAFYDDCLFQKPESTTYIKGLQLGEEVKEGDPAYWLSPREALQKYCELMNTLYGNTWVRKAFEVHEQIGTGLYNYSKMGGLEARSERREGENVITVMADFRHKHEISAAKNLKNIKSVLVRIKSKRVPNPPFNHRSETEQAEIPDTEFDYIINNDGSIQDLHNQARDLVNRVLHNL
jgi:hypothetical protein